ncbi:FG-GAP-like repeat-containing protein [Aestuariibaculum sp. YM273]|uniref:FG-GAP-like repeat-containing protein n=1 Tax=Aestuariibaculum sp. YM273 TaxID=3070659 RepID=UPI0027DD96DA|nr:FG-GAP-like repeat-containing protein [Aestuariibaculum sp. YM273]WMI65693.1 FG-GAP-like repeat-containing protein [Aestuariibaculum sp. YM273]
MMEVLISKLKAQKLKLLTTKYHVCLSICIVFSFLTNLNAQTFERIENYAGLGTATQNNGTALADYDADGDLDIFVVAKAQDVVGNANTHSKLFRNNNDGTFTDVTQTTGLVNLFPVDEPSDYTDALNGFKYGAFWGDYDNDGYPDIFFTHIFKVQLFHNEGNGTFKEVTLEAGFKKYNQNVNTGATWFDYNNDGFLDIYISDWGSEDEGNRLFKNNGDGTFTNVTGIIQGVLINKHSYQSVPFDFNGDGWMDLYVANDYATESNDLYINNKGLGFTEEAATYGLDFSKDDMGIAVGDYNGDGAFDMYITAIGDNQLFENQGNNSFVNKGRSLGVYNTGWAWDVVFSDFDLDRDEDLFVLNGFEFGSSGRYKNTYYQNSIENFVSRLADNSAMVGLGEETISVTEAVFDYDNDGDLDIFVTNNDGPSYFYENKLTDVNQPAEDLHWFKVKLEGTTSNRDAIGTTLSVKTAGGLLHRYYSGKGFLSQHLKPVHFGLGADTEILELKITWPSGLIETHTNIPADKTILAREGNGYQILDIQPSIKPYGCTDPDSCNYNPDATVSTGMCNYLETSKITGTIKTHKNSIESYSYPVTSDLSLTWKVTGGEIIEEPGIGNIIVKWGIGTTGTITLTASNSKCSSEPVVLSVTLLEEDVNFKEQSIARLWNETLLSLIRKDYARPTVHARNLFHTSVVLYDAWAVYDDKASTYLLGNTLHGFNSDFEGFTTTDNVIEARKKTISYAAYRLLSERFAHAPNPTLSQSILDEVMAGLGYDISITDEDYTTGNPIALGNYIASQMIVYGLQDGSNEINQYANQYYQPVNAPLSLTYPEGVADINPDRWQPLSFNNFIDQSGNVIGGVTPGFLSPEWGSVQPFSMEEEDKTTYTRDGHDYQVYYDPGAPPMSTSEDYKWCFSLVSKWSSHLDPHDGVLWDVSPKSIGNITEDHFPLEYADYKNFYKELEGGDIGVGRSRNPVTQLPYQEQIVPRGDYTRVLAEFWADGPDSETPPGHWFTILNYVNDHEMFTKQFEGEGNILSDLEWDVKAYFLMGGAMHDAAIAAWGVKGWYDYIRPISAIRYMCEIGQCTDTSQSNYNPDGIHLQDGLIEIVKEGDPLAGTNNEHVGKIKLYAWKGHDFIEDPKVDEAGVGWILAETWWPYQRPTFVTPPFAGFVSGHSTYSRAAAEVMTLLTGDEYFPGGMGEFLARKNEFLVFEEGPSVDVTLQWATYRDASDQCSLSRIWGGIHPPADDIPGRFMGIKIGQKAFSYGKQYFEGSEPSIDELTTELKVYPNPISTSSNSIKVSNTQASDVFQLFDIKGRFLQYLSNTYTEATKVSELHFTNTLSTGVYVLKINNLSRKIVVISK